MADRFVLAFLIYTSCTVAGQSPEYALKGGHIEFKTDISAQPDEILWKHNGNKVVEFNGNEQQEYSPYENRITLDWFSADLQINNLDYIDSGEYVLEAYVNKVLRPISFYLKVIDKVESPTISCETNSSSDSNKSGKLMCSAGLSQPESLLKFEWSSHGNVQPGPQLAISLGGQHDEEVYSCTVSNPVSQDTASFTAKDCYPANGLPIGVIVGVIFGIVIAIGIAIGFIIYKLRYKADSSAEVSKSNKTPHPENQSLLRSNPAGKDADSHQVIIEPGENNAELEIPSMKKRNEPRESPDTVNAEPHAEEESQPRHGADDSEEEPGKDTADTYKSLVAKRREMFDSQESKNEKQRRFKSKNLSTKKNPGSEQPADEFEDIQSPSSAETSLAAEPCSPLTKSSPNVTLKDTPGKPEEESESDQVTEGTVGESEDSTEKNQPSIAPKQKHLETSVHEQDSNSESPDTVNAEPHPEEESQPRHGADDSDEQPGKDTADTYKSLVAERKKMFDLQESMTEKQKRFQSKNLSTKKNPGSEQPADEFEDIQSPSSAETSLVAEPCSPLTKSSPNVTLKDTPGKPEEESESDQVTEGAVGESEDSTEKNQPSIAPKQKHLETSVHEQDSNSESPDTVNAEPHPEEESQPRHGADDSEEEPGKDTADTYKSLVAKRKEMFDPQESKNEKLSNLKNSS